MGFGKDGKGALIREHVGDAALGALTHFDVVKVDSQITLGEDFRILKSKIWAVINSITGSEGEGLLFGICNGDLTDAEIEECIEALGPNDRNDTVQGDRAERWVKVLGKFTQMESSGRLELVGENGQNAVISKDRWTYSNPEGWDYFIYNIGGSLTTGGLCHLYAEHYGVWVT